MLMRVNPSVLSLKLSNLLDKLINKNKNKKMLNNKILLNNNMNKNNNNMNMNNKLKIPKNNNNNNNNKFPPLKSLLKSKPNKLLKSLKLLKSKLNNK